MQFKRITKILKYMDIYGTKYTFYSNKRPKLYTVTGGILSIISIFYCTLIPIFFSLDDLKRTSPMTIESSILSEGDRKIKFGQEKIWIPWRIVDYNNNEYVNHTGLLFPIIHYILSTKNKETKEMKKIVTKINYKLCNETFMRNENNLYKIKIPLNELYCIDMDELDIGSTNAEFINYIQFDLYYCEDGINYDEKNPKCISYNKIMDSIGNNNSLKMTFYYPVVHFQPTNIKNPILIIYKKHSFNLGKYTNKIEKIFLKKNIFTDDLGWLMKKELNTSYWGMDLIYGDNYFIGDENDFINQGINSKAYSLSIYLESDITHYKRYYKKLNSIFSEALPFAFIIFFIFKHISKLFKFAEGNKKIIELLFENLKEKPNQLKENIQKIKNINNIGRINYSKDDSNIKNRKKPKMTIDYLMKSKNDDIRPPIMINKKRYTNISVNNLNLKSSKLFNQNKKINNDMSHQNLIFESSKVRDFNLNEEKINKSKINRKHLSDNNLISKYKKNNLIIGKLFPYKYYLCSVFIKNLNISQGNFFFSSRFAKVYTFLCQLFDVTTYISLQREFSVLKNGLSENNIKIIENYNKINVNSKNFLKDISYCIGEQKLHILAQGTKK